MTPINNDTFAIDISLLVTIILLTGAVVALIIYKKNKKESEELNNKYATALEELNKLQRLYRKTVAECWVKHESMKFVMCLSDYDDDMFIELKKESLRKKSFIDAVNRMYIDNCSIIYDANEFISVKSKLKRTINHGIDMNIVNYDRLKFDLNNINWVFNQAPSEKLYENYMNMCIAFNQHYSYTKNLISTNETMSTDFVMLRQHELNNYYNNVVSAEKLIKDVINAEKASVDTVKNGKHIVMEKLNALRRQSSKPGMDDFTLDQVSALIRDVDEYCSNEHPPKYELKAINEFLAKIDLMNNLCIQKYQKFMADRHKTFLPVGRPLAGASRVDDDTMTLVDTSDLYNILDDNSEDEE